VDPDRVAGCTLRGKEGQKKRARLRVSGKRKKVRRILPVGGRSRNESGCRRRPRRVVERGRLGAADRKSTEEGKSGRNSNRRRINSERKGKKLI